MTRTLAIRDISAGEARWEGTVEVPADLVYFEGHFVDYPVLPAVAQLEAFVLGAVAEAWPGLGRLERLTRLKFRRVIPPGAVLRLRLERSAGAVRFEIRRDDEICSSGSLHFEAPPP